MLVVLLQSVGLFPIVLILVRVFVLADWSPPDADAPKNISESLGITHGSDNSGGFDIRDSYE